MERLYDRINILLPNIRYNKYELYKKTNFWDKVSYLLLVDCREHPIDRSKDDIYTRMEPEVYKGKIISLEDWSIIKSNIEYLNILANSRLTRQLFTYIRSDEFRNIASKMEGAIMPPFSHFMYSAVFDIINFANPNEKVVIDFDKITITRSSRKYVFSSKQFKHGLIAYWTIFLWKEYNNYVKTGFKTFKMINEIPPNNYFWEWLDRFHLIK